MKIMTLSVKINLSLNFKKRKRQNQFKFQKSQKTYKYFKDPAIKTKQNPYIPRQRANKN